MLTIDQIKEKMKDRKVDAVAANIGVHKQTLYMILWGKRKPSYVVLEKLSDYLTKE